MGTETRGKEMTTDLTDFKTKARLALPTNMGYDAKLRGRSAKENPFIEGSDEFLAWNTGHAKAVVVVRAEA